MKAPRLAVFLLVSGAALAGQANPPAPPKPASALPNATLSPVPSSAGAFEPAKPGTRVRFLNLKNRQVVPTRLLVKFGVEGMKIEPAGNLVSGTGHHHLIIDGDAIPPGQVVPADATHIHYGKGQTEAEIELAPGRHKLTLQFADGAHRSYGPEASGTVDVIAK